MSKALIKDTLRTIRKNFSRYVSILLIIALGTAFFVGIKATAPDMFATAEKYFTDYNLMDIRVQSLAGLTDEDLNAIRSLHGVAYVKGQKFTDALVKVNGEIISDIDGTRISARAYGISPEHISDFISGDNDGSYINRVEKIEGEFPQQIDECLVDASQLSTPDEYKIGSTITLETESGNSPSTLTTNTFKIVGIIRSPYYLSFERGNTTVGSGKVGTFIIIPDEAFKTDYYSEAYITVEGADSYDPYSDEYFEYISPLIENIQALSTNQCIVRAAHLKPQLRQQIADGEKLIENSSAEISEKLKELDDTILQLEDFVTNGDTIVEEAEKEFNEKFAQAEGNLTGKTEEYYAAIEEYSNQEQLYQTKLAEYNSESIKLQQARTAYDEAFNAHSDAKNAIEYAKQTITTTNNLIAAGETMLQKIEDLQTDSMSQTEIQGIVNSMKLLYPDLYDAVEAMTTQGLATEIATALAPYIEQQKQSLALLEKELAEKETALNEVETQLAENKTKLDTATRKLADAKTELTNAEAALQAANSQLNQLGLNIQSGSLQIEIERVKAETQLNELKNQVNNAPVNLSIAKEKRAQAVAQLDSELRAAQEEVSAAKTLLSKLDSFSWNVYDRNDTPGYQSYGQSVENIRILSNIFPIFFFALSSMICLTTLTRLIDEDRVFIGTYKALGYSRASIVAKYIIYSFSACLFGTILGVGIAVFLFPYAINSAYSIMYSLPSLIYIFPWGYALLSLLISIICTTLVTAFAIYRELQTNPAVLMRPKAPKAGKRILLEKAGFLWKRLNFTAKVTARNLFRNKQRFAMTLFGIAGCTALLIASLGMHNSISAILSEQYGDDAISKFDFQLVFSTPQSKQTPSYEFSKANDDSRVSSLMLTAMKSMTAKGETSDKTLEVYVLVPAAPEEISSYIDLRERLSGNECTLTDDGAIITEKLAKDTAVGVGDNIQFTDSDGKVYSVKVSAIAENYTFHYIYMTENTYTAVTGRAPDYYYAVGNLSDSFAEMKDTELANSKGLLSTDFMKTDGITAVAFTSDTTEGISRITDALSVVIVLFFVSALILAFVVLYNLSNINIIERNREIATLKVLGFIDKEVSSYIYRENIFVSLFGMAAGIVLGIILHRLLISFTAIDTVMYGQHISWYSYVIALSITAIIIVLVNLILHRKLKKVDMVLSLKSVE